MITPNGDESRLGFRRAVPPPGAGKDYNFYAIIEKDWVALILITRFPWNFKPYFCRDEMILAITAEML